MLSGAWAQSFGEVVRPARIEPPERYVAPRPKGEPIREYREPPIEEEREPPIEEARERKPASPRASAASRAAEKPADPEASDPEKTSPRAKSKRSARATEGRREATPKAAAEKAKAAEERARPFGSNFVQFVTSSKPQMIK